jgi:hypothetical protein
MKQYLVDELRPADYDQIKAFLEPRYAVPGFAGLYWIPLPSQMLAEEQSDHTECQPHYFALELLPDRLACELLVRSQQRIRCSCIQYASERQRNWIIQVVDTFLEQLGVKS